MAFHKFIQSFDTIIHFNGNSFDIPFLMERGKKYNLDLSFDRFQSIDIYRPLARLNHILKLENQKQKTFEKFLNIKRTDPFSGGDLIEVYKHFVESKDQRLIVPLLLHNMEDVLSMGSLISLFAISDLFQKKFTVSDFQICTCKDMEGNPYRELRIQMALQHSVPTPLSYYYNNIYFRAEKETFHLSVKIQSGEYKYYFTDYKNYYYLPVEDRAIHKSVGQFVNASFRRQATSSTCYEKVSGEFLPFFHADSSVFDIIFKENIKDKHGFILLDTINERTIFEYACEIIDYLKKTPPK